MPDQVAQVAAGTGLVMLSQVRDAPGDVKVTDVLDRDHVRDSADVLRAKGGFRPLGHRDILVSDLGEPLEDHILEGVEILPPQYREAHDVAAVPGAVELQQTVPHADPLLLGSAVQRLLVARSEFVKVMFRISCGLLNLIDPPGIIWNVFLVFRIDSVNFPIRGSLSEQGRQEKLAESIQCSI